MLVIVITEIDLLPFCLFTEWFYINNLHNNCIEKIFVEQFIAAFFEGIGQSLRKQTNTFCDIAQSIWTMINCIHRRHVCEQSLCRANIGSCFFSLYMLFSCLQS